MPRSQPNLAPTRQIVLLLAALFVSGIGFGITLPVLPFYALRLMGTPSGGGMSLHVTGLTSVYALMQFVFAPAWGAWSDRIGRRRVIQIGILGTAVSQVIFGLASSLFALYLARILGGILSASLIPAATAYFADFSTDENRPRHMAWLGTVSSLGTVAGLILGGAVTVTGLGFLKEVWPRGLDSFSLPFFIAALLMGLASIAVWRWLPDSTGGPKDAHRNAPIDWQSLIVSLRTILILAIVSQFGLTLFEASFPLYAQKKFNYGPEQIGSVFLVCGVVMSVFQVILVTSLARWVSAAYQLALGFTLMAVGIFALLVAREFLMVLSAVGVIALGMAIIAPNLSALGAKDRGTETGAAMGVLSAANNFGQALGPLIGGALLGLSVVAPYSVTGLMMLATALITVFGMRAIRVTKDSASLP